MLNYLASYLFSSLEAYNVTKVNLADINPKDPTKANSIFEFNALDINGNVVNFSKYDGQVTYIVNVASKWGLTDVNYAEMSTLHSRYHAQGLRILAFPCNQFAKQEPGTNHDIKKFAEKRGVKFDLFSKIEVNGDSTHPLYVYLKHVQGGYFGNSIKWNFSKFLCNKKGVPVKRYGPTESPLSAENDIRAELGVNR